jgi:hypothetical protein
MSNQQIQKKPTAAYILSLLGGIFGLLLSLAFIAYAISTVQAVGTSLLSIWMLIASILIIFFAGKLNANPIEHSKWGALIFALSIFSIFGLFAIIGGIAALVYNPNPATPSYVQSPPAPQPYVPHPYPPQQAPTPFHSQTIREKETIIREIVMVPCRYCGALSPQLSTFCQHCGAKKTF